LCDYGLKNTVAWLPVVAKIFWPANNFSLCFSELVTYGTPEVEKWNDASICVNQLTYGTPEVEMMLL
jgi:hypothetical protein